MQVLRVVRELDLPDGWVAAGFVRSLVWDHLHGRTISPMPNDIDVIWFDKAHTLPGLDRTHEQRLTKQCGGLGWSVKNQARMHQRNNDPPYQSSGDAMTFWPETATAVGVRLGPHDELEILAPLGLEDLFAGLVRPTERFSGEKHRLFLERIQSKRWSEPWPDLTFVIDQ